MNLKFSLQQVNQASYVFIGHMGCKTLASLKTSPDSTRPEEQALTWISRSDLLARLNSLSEYNVNYASGI